MSANWKLIELSATLVQAYIIVMFTHDFLGGRLSIKTDKIAKILMWLFFSVAVVVCNSVTYFEGMAIVIFLLLLFVYSVVFLSGSLLIKMIASVVPILCTVSIGSLTFHFISLVFEKDLYVVLTEPGMPRLLLLIIAQLLLYYALFAILKISRKGEVRFTKTESLLIIFVLLISIVLFIMIDLVMLSNDLPGDSLILLMSCIAGLIMINIVTLYLVSGLSKKNAVEMQNQLLQQQLAYQDQYSEATKQQYQASVQIRHDLKHHFSVLSLLIAQGKYKQAEDFLNELVETTLTAILPIKTKNETLNAILNLKLSYAQSLGIQTVCVVPEEFTILNDVEICSVFGNLLDNAIEYCEKHLELKNEISVTIGYNGARCTILVTNRLHASVLDTNADLTTAKSDKGRHGIGIKSVGDIVSEHDGMLNFYEQDGMFCAMIIFFI